MENLKWGRTKRLRCMKVTGSSSVITRSTTSRNHRLSGEIRTPVVGGRPLLRKNKSSNGMETSNTENSYKPKRGDIEDTAAIQAKHVSQSNFGPQMVISASDTNRLREELSCAICFSILFKPTTTSCGHSFCMKCFSMAVDKCGKFCPTCRKPTSQERLNVVNTILWNTVCLLFSPEVEARQAAEE